MPHERIPARFVERRLSIWAIATLLLGLATALGDADIIPKEGIISVAMALGAAVIAFGTTPSSIPDITRRENYLTVITLLHAAWLGLALARVLP